MKKLRKLLLFVALTVIACFSLLFTGCSSGTVYKFEKLTYDMPQQETTVSMCVGDEFQGIELTEEFITITMKGDQVIIRTHMEMDDESFTEVQVGTIVEGYENEIYFVSEDGDVMIAEKDGKTLKVEYTLSGITMTLTLTR